MLDGLFERTFYWLVMVDVIFSTFLKMVRECRQFIRTNHLQIFQYTDEHLKISEDNLHDCSPALGLDCKTYSVNID